MRVPPRPLVLAVAGVALWGTALLSVTLAPPASAATPPVGLGTAGSFAVLAGAAVTNTGPSVIDGDLGVAPGLAVTGFPPGLLRGAQQRGGAVAGIAENDLGTAYVDVAGRGPAIDQTGVDLGGQRLLPGVYAASTSMSLTGTVTLDALGDPDAIFVLKAGSTLLTASGSSVDLVGSAQACNVFWQVGSSATLGTSTRFAGTILALTSATLRTGASVEGRVLARNGQVSLDTNVITRPRCATTPVPGTPSPAAVPTTAPATPAATPSRRPSGKPSDKPSSRPSSKPSGRPSGGPSGGPSATPSGRSSTPGNPGSTTGTDAGDEDDDGRGADTGTDTGSATDSSTTTGTGTGTGTGIGTGTVVPAGRPDTGRSPSTPTTAASSVSTAVPLGLGVLGLLLLGLALGGALSRAGTHRSR